MSPLLALELVLLLAAAFCVVAALVAAVIWPRWQTQRQRHDVADEVRFAQWRLQQVTSAAMQQLLDEARQRQ